MVYVYFLHELYLLSLKIFIFISFKISRFFKINQRFNTINVNMKTISVSEKCRCKNIKKVYRCNYIKFLNFYAKQS